VTNLRAPRGTKDILPPESHLWHEIERTIDEVARLFGYDEIRTPTFEQSALFKRSVGEETDIVSKEMYLFNDKGGEEMALRPELTASVVRAAIEHNLINQPGALQRLYYNSAPMFRYERPQMGRQRQFHQFGVELLGASSPLADLQVIAFALAVYKKLGFSNFHLRLNTLGSKASRTAWHLKLHEYLSSHKDSLSEDSKRRLETNTLRVLDSKNEGDKAIVKNAPSILDYLDADDKAHFDELQELLKASQISYSIEPTLVRGLDYYSRTVFELTSSDLGSQDALCGGGRYDGLIEQLGGPKIPAVGFAAGVERLVIVLQKLRAGEIKTPNPYCYIVLQTQSGKPALIELASGLRNRGYSVVYDLQGRSLKAQMREADKSGCKYVIIIGESELAEGMATLKNMETSEQRKENIAILAQSAILS
jgi:histidyl-tRNA synthetase